MDEYIELLILAYFREFHKEYDLTDLKNKIGISYTMLDEYLSKLVDEQKLKYIDNLLRITKEGRIALMNSELESYSYSQELEQIYSSEKWSLDKIYCVHKFGDKKWRGNRK